MNKFKVGDRVRCIGEATLHFGDSDYGGGGWEEGLTFIIKEIIKGTHPCYFPAKDGFGVYEDYLELVSSPSKLTDKQIGILEGVIKCDGEFCTVDVLCEKECLVFKECGDGGVGGRERRVLKAQQLLAENKVKIKTKESNMNQNIIKLFPKDTAAADLVERYLGSAFTGGPGDVLTILSKGKEADILAEAKRLEAESKKDK
jgi:hypothetical protein